MKPIIFGNSLHLKTSASHIKSCTPHKKYSQRFSRQKVKEAQIFLSFILRTPRGNGHSCNVSIFSVDIFVKYRFFTDDFHGGTGAVNYLDLGRMQTKMKKSTKILR